ncbi:hypothetical protein KIPB_003098 [Kipferlia bialata]|uniref:Kelch-type beta propeller n=1 Tax=Kipferlia bialata TaxID=797122 RepID=A0A391NSV4_9EUKA|nr:hypothetical protein KIPB_003098 [Kipferlia bialata]|eukprot:g3098.t1
MLGLLTLQPDMSLEETIIPLPDWGEGVVMEAIPSPFGVVYALVSHCGGDSGQLRLDSGVTRTDLWVLHLDSLEWEMVPHNEGETWPAPAAYRLSGCIDGDLVVGGGIARDQHIQGEGWSSQDIAYVNDVWRLDPENLYWRQFSICIPKDAQYGYRLHTFAVQGGAIYDMSGCWISCISDKHGFVSVCRPGDIHATTARGTVAVGKVVCAFGSHDAVGYMCVYDPLTEAYSPMLPGGPEHWVRSACMLDPTTMLLLTSAGHLVLADVDLDVLSSSLWEM